MRLVTNDEVPVRRGLKFGLQGFRAGGHIEAHYERAALDERVASD